MTPAGLREALFSTGPINPKEHVKTLRSTPPEEFYDCLDWLRSVGLVQDLPDGRVAAVRGLGRVAHGPTRITAQPHPDGKRGRGRMEPLREGSARGGAAKKRLCDERIAKAIALIREGATIREAGITKAMMCHYREKRPEDAARIYAALAEGAEKRSRR